MNEYHCVICTRKFRTDNTITQNAMKLCSAQCKEINRHKRVITEREYRFNYVDKNRNRVFEVSDFDLAKDVQSPSSRSPIRQQGTGSKIRITSR